LDTILAKAVWVERDKEDVAEWLKKNGYAKSEDLANPRQY
jgi:aminopeptidase 2